MKKYQIKIELLSDLCVSAGGGYNSAVDTDICYDPYGFPYIPGKRLKGCLRECAIELNDWGQDISVKKLFGDEGDERAACRIGNACLEQYEDMKKEIEENPACPLYHPQNVLNRFSYIRTQTSINYDTGVAEKGMLRTMRVANKGLVFLADVEVEEAYEDELALCCKVFRHMGIARTRGLGEVHAELVPVVNEVESVVHASLKEDADYLEYKILIEDPVICKSVAGGEAKTLDYIEGNKIFGMIASGMKKDGKDVVAFLNEGEFICSNAYIGEQGLRFTEVPACYYTIKNVKEEYIDKIFSTPEDEKDLQINAMKHAYVFVQQDGLVKKSVDVEERYHHRRPEDKSVGRAVETSDKSGFYHMSSISPRQEFYGFIKGTKEQVKAAYQYLTANQAFYIGFSRNSEYGKVKVQIINTRKLHKAAEVAVQEFLVKLEAPVILYNDNAFYSVDIRNLQEEVSLNLGIEQDNVDSVDCYMKYVTLGGYNVTWRSRKPIMEAFDKGTVLHIRLKNEVNLELEKHYFLGERVTEGYGEVTILPIEKENIQARKPIVKVLGKEDGKGFKVEKDSLLAGIAEDFLKSYIKAEAIKDAGVFEKNQKGGREEERFAATINNMISMCKESVTYEQVKESVQKRFDKNTGVKEEKSKLANAILEFGEVKAADLVNRFCEQYVLTWQNVEDKRLVYLYELLIALKYIFRQGGKDHE